MTTVAGDDPFRGYLLDTHTALWALLEPERLSAGARGAVLAGRSVLSAISYWEVMLKSTKGRLDVGDPRIWWQTALEHLNAMPLTLRPQHIDALQGLPDYHRDPFDRMLIAQAMAEGLTLVSADRDMARYKAAGLKVVR